MLDKHQAGKYYYVVVQDSLGNLKAVGCDETAFNEATRFSTFCGDKIQTY